MKDKEVLKQFDMIFCSNSQKHLQDMPVLMKIFSKLDDSFYIVDDEYEKLRKEKISIESKLLPKLSVEERTLYNNLEEIENKMKGQCEKQMFVFGYLLARQIDFESKK